MACPLTKLPIQCKSLIYALIHVTLLITISTAKFSRSKACGRGNRRCISRCRSGSSCKSNRRQIYTALTPAAIPSATDIYFAPTEYFNGGRRQNYVSSASVSTLAKQRGPFKT